MNMKTIFALSVASVSFAACGVDEDAAKSIPVQESYTRDFIKTFGTINPNQDWNVVEQKSVTINTSSPVDVLIYEKQGGEYKLAADYKAVSGSKTITFDGLEGDDTPFIVSLDGNMLPATNGETVNYNGQAAGVKRTSAIPSDCSWINRAENGTKITLSSDDNIMEILSTDGQDHTKTVTVAGTGYTEFLEKGQGVTFYPMYWNSTYTHTAGIYYYDKDKAGIVRVPMYTDHDSDDLAFYTYYELGTLKFWGDPSYYTESGQTNCWYYDNWGSLVKRNHNVSYASDFQFKSHAYTVTPEQSILCGIYVQIGNKYYYSNPALNDDRQAHFAYRTVGSGNSAYTYLCFDDPETNDKDYNDLVFYTPRQLTPVTKKEISWLVACEDLGGTFDYDFNDIVFRVYHLSGNNYLTIVPAAAGGTLEAYLYYGDTQVSDEWHQHFGDGHDYTDMINTGRIEEKNVWPIRLTGVPTDFSMTQFTQASSDDTTDANDGGFKILVKNGDSTYSVTRPSKGAAPQMLVLPSDWQWPVELTRITTTYPDFGTWGENYTTSSWVSNKVADTFINMTENDIKQSKEIKVVPVK